jgi:predicted CoA-binding protein
MILESFLKKNLKIIWGLFGKTKKKSAKKLSKNSLGHVCQTCPKDKKNAFFLYKILTSQMQP